MEYPRLRPMDIFPLEVSGEEVICLRDPQNITDKVIFIPYHVFDIVRFFDGRHSIPDIQTEYTRHHGGLIFREQVEKIIRELDAHLFLESEGFHRFLKELKDAFRRSSIRKATLAGKSYEREPDRLRQQIESFFTSWAGTEGSSEKESSGRVKGAILPHIDFGRGGSCFARGYKEIETSARAGCFILLGTAHGETEGLFALTRKDFETPLGILRTDQELVGALERGGGKGFFQGEFAHRTEHSIEFQVVFLQYLYGDRDITIVPILCSSFHEIIQKGISPLEVPEVRDFVNFLKGAVRDSGREVFILASADLSHVGPRFGDPFRVGPEVLGQVAQEDMDMIGYIERLDAEGFFSSVQKVRDRRRICGLAPIYILLQCIEASRGKLLKYEQWPDPMGTVSFASICLY